MFYHESCGPPYYFLIVWNSDIKLGLVDRNLVCTYSVYYPDYEIHILEYALAIMTSSPTFITLVFTLSDDILHRVFSNAF